MSLAVHLRLVGHPDNAECLPARVEVSLARQAETLAIDYRCHGYNYDLDIPTPHHPAPANALWQTTCCELFAGPLGETAYREFNFSPSGQWAAYDFSAQRTGARPVALSSPPVLSFARSEQTMTLAVTLPLAALPPAAAWRLALAVILADRAGRRGYWALAHPPGPPDFHHPSGFALSLTSAGFQPAFWP